MRFKLNQEGIDHDHKRTPAAVHVWVAARAHALHELQPGPILRNSGFLLSGVARLPGARPGTHGCRKLDTLARSRCAGGSHIDLSESDSALYVRVLAELLSIARKYGAQD